MKKVTNNRDIVFKGLTTLVHQARQTAWLLVLLLGFSTAASNAMAELLQVPANGWSMAEVRERFGEPSSISDPVGEPPVVLWDYVKFSVYFENDQVIVAMGGDSAQNGAVSQGMQSGTQLNQVTNDTSQRAIAMQTLDSDVNTDTMQTIPVANKVENASLNAGGPSHMPINGMSMSAVTSKFGEPRAMDSAVGNPPISVWHYDSFSVYFEHDKVIVSAPARGGAGNTNRGVVVDSAPDLEQVADPAN